MVVAPSPQIPAALDTAWHEYEEFTDGSYGTSVSSSTWSTLGSSLEELCRFGMRSVLEVHMLDTRRKKFKENERELFWRRLQNVEQNADVCGENASEKAVAVGHIQAALADLHGKLTRETKRLAHFEELLQSACGAPSGEVELPEATTSGREGWSGDSGGENLAKQHKLAVGAILVDSASPQFSGILESFFRAKFADFNKAAKRACEGMEEEESGFLEFEYDEEDEEGSVAPLDGENDEAGKMLLSPQKEEQDFATCSGGVDGSGEEGAHGEPLDDSGSKWEVVSGEVAAFAGCLHSLGLGALCQEAYTTVLYTELEAKIGLVAADRYTAHVLPVLYRWMEMVPLQFLFPLLPATPAGGEAELRECLGDWKVRLHLYAHHQLGSRRTAALFDMVVDYPESLPAIEDLRQCLGATGEREKTVTSFRGALRRRLLTGGAATVDILHHYVNTIKSLRALDPTGVVLDCVGDPIRDYLRGRRDTGRCVVSWLTDDGGRGTLAAELSKGPQQAEEGDVYNEEAAMVWEPDPVEAEAESRSRRSHDIIRLLVGLLGSQESLVAEVRTALAEKLLSKGDYDTDAEIRILELIKLRFGEKSFHSCEVMLKDVADSKRINANVKRKAPPPSGPPAPAPATLFFPPRNPSSACPPLEVVDATVVSAHFWPDLQEAEMSLPPPVERVLQEYARVYHDLKSPRKLKWVKNRGSVKLELEFEDCSLPFTVSPLLATLILQFTHRSEWTDAQLAAETGMELENLRRRMSFWVNHGVLLETSLPAGAGTLYTAPDRFGGREEAGSEGHGGVGESEEVSAASGGVDEPRALQESYVVGMLTTFGEGLSVERIHNMLKMFMADPPYDNTLPQLQRFLNRMVAEEKLEQDEHMYRKHR